jgi:hypothetical protein
MKVCPKATAAKTREKKTGFIVDTKKTRTSSGMVEREGKTLPSAAVYIYVCHRLRTASLANLGSADRLANYLIVTNKVSHSVRNRCLECSPFCKRYW